MKTRASAWRIGTRIALVDITTSAEPSCEGKGSETVIRVQVTELPSTVDGRGVLPDLTREMIREIFEGIARKGLPWVSYPMRPEGAEKIQDEFTAAGARVVLLPE